MDKEELKKKITEQTRKLQKKAAKMDAALTAAEERAEFAKMVAEERARQDAKKRTFANPQNADEAEGKIPSLEQLANGEPEFRPGDWKWKSKEEILEDGTLLEKFRLYFSSGDLDNYFGTKDKLSKKEIAKIVASIRTKEDKELAKVCTKEYQALIAYGKQLSYFFKRFQAAYAMLATLLNKWDSYEQTAKSFTQMYVALHKEMPTPTHEERKPYKPEWEIKGTDDFLLLWVNEAVSMSIFDGASLRFDRAKQMFWVDAGQFPTLPEAEAGTGIYLQIQNEAKEATEALADFKAFVVVIEDFIRNSTLGFMPISIQMAIENAEEERYTRYLVKNLSFFRSELNERKEKGETITPEEEKMAVIPDYYEVTPPQDMYKSCQKLIKQLMS